MTSTAVAPLGRHPRRARETDRHTITEKGVYAKREIQREKE